MPKKDGNFLDWIPERDCRFEETGEGAVALIVPRFRNRFMKWIAVRMGRSEFVRVRLDENGSRVWKAMDGKRTVEAIGALLPPAPEESSQQVYERLSQYLSILHRNRFIRLSDPGGNS